MRLLISHQHDLFKINECELLYALPCSTKAAKVMPGAAGAAHVKSGFSFIRVFLVSGRAELG
jgi:hypothetical protein